MTGLREVDGSCGKGSSAGEEQSIIERKFFKKEISKFTELFHNGSFKAA
jgi:hypothetical protein